MNSPNGVNNVPVLHDIRDDGLANAISKVRAEIIKTNSTLEGTDEFQEFIRQAVSLNAKQCGQWISHENRQLRLQEEAMNERQTDYNRASASIRT